MGWFGKKKSEFDQVQDKALNQLAKNQGVLIKNNDYFIAQNKKLWAWINNLKSRMEALEAEAIKNKQRDAELSQKFKSLGSVMSTTAEEGG